MPIDYLKTGRRWLALIPVAIILASIAIWFSTRETLPKTIRVATANKGGLYHEFGKALEQSLEKNAGCDVIIVETEGSGENAKLLSEGKVDLAIIQSGSRKVDDFSVIAPLYPEVVHIVARNESSIQSIDGLKSHRVIIGPEGSGMQSSALRILKHYGIEKNITTTSDVYFKDLLKHETIEAAIVTTGLMNRDLQSMLASGHFQLLSVESSEAIVTKDPVFHLSEIPRGLYREGPTVPPTNIPSVATTALLVTQEGENELLIEETLEAIYNGGLALKFPTMISKEDALKKSPLALNLASRIFFNPPDRVGRITETIETLAAFKELSVAIAAGLYLLWTRRKKKQKERQEKLIQKQKDKLDTFLNKTLEVERAQMETTDIDTLKSYLDRVTEIKLEALTRFTQEELRSDQSFEIFLLQCGNLISKIQMKIQNCSQPPRT